MAVKCLGAVRRFGFGVLQCFMSDVVDCGAGDSGVELSRSRAFCLWALLLRLQGGRGFGSGFGLRELLEMLDFDF